MRDAKSNNQTSTGETARARGACSSASRRSVAGMTLIELVIVITVLSILMLGVIPLVRNSVRRQKEQELRLVLRDMRAAIEEFHRDTIGMNCGGAPLGGGAPNPPGVPGVPGPQGFLDPRSRVVISDCKIFTVDNPDRYPPDLETLVNGVNVVPRAMTLPGGGVPGGSLPSGNATETKLLSTKKKIYLREIPVDPITGEKDWCIISNYDPPDEGCSSNPANVFDVRSKAEGTALNGEKYSDW